jgi:cellulose synthase/poly-beta-1,6-N-acetylglucosamine synthase-like glycosyltransferase
MWMVVCRSFGSFFQDSRIPQVTTFVILGYVNPFFFTSICYSRISHWPVFLKCSPYSVKVFVPCPQNARVTLKVDLIFEEYGNITIR